VINFTDSSRELLSALHTSSFTSVHPSSKAEWSRNNGRFIIITGSEISADLDAFRKATEIIWRQCEECVWRAAMRGKPRRKASAYGIYGRRNSKKYRHGSGPRRAVTSEMECQHSATTVIRRNNIGCFTGRGVTVSEPRVSPPVPSPLSTIADDDDDGEARHARENGRNPSNKCIHTHAHLYASRQMEKNKYIPWSLNHGCPWRLSFGARRPGGGGGVAARGRGKGGRIGPNAGHVCVQILYKSSRKHGGCIGGRLIGERYNVTNELPFLSIR